MVLGTNGIIVSAGANDKVVLDGLDIDGFRAAGLTACMSSLEAWSRPSTAPFDVLPETASTL